MLESNGPSIIDSPLSLSLSLFFSLSFSPSPSLSLSLSVSCLISFTSKPDDNKQQSVQDISGPLILERYVAIADYDKQKKNECSLRAGQTVEVVDKNQNGMYMNT